MPAPFLRTAALIVAFAALGAACSKPPKPAVDAGKIIEAIHADEARWNTEWIGRGAGAIAGHFAADAIFMPANAEAASGEAAITGSIKDILDDAGFTFSFASDSVEVSAGGDMAIAHGTYKETDTDPRSKSIINSSGNYVAVYKPQADGSWKIYWFIDSPALSDPNARK